MIKNIREEIKVVAKLTFEDKRLFEGTGKIMLSNGEIAYKKYLLQFRRIECPTLIF